MLSVACSVMVVLCWRLMLRDGCCCLSFVVVVCVCSVLHVVCCLLFVVCCRCVFVGRCSLFVVRCLMFLV